MARNAVQFQKGLSMAEFLRLYGTEDRCHAAVVAMRWPGGFVCPRCAGSKHFTSGVRDLWKMVPARADVCRRHAVH